MKFRVAKLVVCLAAGLALFTPTTTIAATARAIRPAKQQATSTTPARDTSATKKKTTTYSATAARNRQATLARARAAAAARARELKDVQTPRFRVDEYGREVPDVRAEAAIIYNPKTNEVLWENHSADQRSMASITKVMTAIVFLDSGADLQQDMVVQRADVFRASTTYMSAGLKLKAVDLLNLLLVGSDNAAARALARISPYGTDGFIAKMNEKAVELGLANTHYADPSGLLSENVSSAYDLARLIAFAASDERISSVMRKPEYTTTSGKRIITAHSTNQIVRAGDIEVMGGKTGFINKSGYCLATLLKLPETGQELAFVVMGAKTNASRFWETRHLFNWMSTRTKGILGDGTTQQQQQQE